MLLQRINFNSKVPPSLQVFQLLMDSLFRSFNDNVRMNNFSELSGCVFSWLEEQCKPQLLQELMLNILQQVLLVQT
jgi:MAX-like protein X